MSLRHAPTPTSTNHKRHSETNTRIAGRWLFVTRLSFVVISIFTLLLYVIGTPVYFAYLHTLCTDCLDDRLNPDKLQALHALGISITTYAVYMVALNLLFALVYFAVAALIFWRKSDDWIAWLASFSLVAFGASFPSIPAVLAAVHPVWQLPVTLVSEDVLGFPSLIIFFFLFPTGRFVPRWTRWVAVGSAALFVLGAFFPGTLLNISNWPSLLFLLVPLVVFGSLVYSQLHASLVAQMAHLGVPAQFQGLVTTAIETGQIPQNTSSYAGFGKLVQEVIGAAYTAFGDGLRAALYLSAGVVLVAGLLSFITLRSRPVNTGS